ncbi:MAG: hypothetical protein EOQ53_02625 [Mesorhizobium sp.]|nr:MAG: hypothetical protein EOQ53_02625 [Mesorhizobium sp.]
MKSAVLLASGGLDSTTVAYRLAADGVDVFPFFLDYGQHCVEMEWDRVNEVLPRGMRRPERCDISDIFNGSSSRLIKEADLCYDFLRSVFCYAADLLSVSRREFDAWVWRREASVSNPQLVFAF